jgi:signal transduction histidine kinase
LALLTLMVCVPPADAQTPRKPLVVGAATDHYPYSYQDSRSGRLTGFAVELLDEVARVGGLTLQRVTGPSADLNRRFFAGEFPVAQVFSYTPGRQGRTKFSAPYLTLKGAFFVRTESGLHLDSVNDLAGRSIIVGEGSTGEEWLQRAGVAMTLVPVATADASLQLLADGRHDAALTSRLTGMAIVTRDGLNVRPTGPPIDELTVSLCFASHDDDRLVQLNEGLAILYRTGDYERIYRRWFARYEPTSFTRQEVAQYAACLLFVVAAAAVWVSWHQRRLSNRVAAQAHELRRMDAELAQGRRLRAVGEMVGGIAHEFNNLLTPIVLKVEMLRDDRRADPTLQRELDVIAGAAERAASLTRRLLMFGRQADHEPGDVRVAEVVAANVELVRPTTDPRIAIAADVPRDLPVLRQSAADVHQIVLNLLLNARDTLQEKLERHPEAEARVTIRADVVGDDQELVVEDTGMGMERDVLERIFEPFFTTKEVGRGTGLGLATVWHLVQACDGRIAVESVPGRGTAFRILLPDKAGATELPGLSASA